MSRLSYTDTNWGVKLPNFLTSLALCELSLARGVPVLQELCLHLIRYAECARPLTNYKHNYVDCKNDLELLDITEKARSDFEQAFDISVGEQLRIENMLRGASIGTQPQREKPKLNLNRFLKTNKTYHKTHHNTYNN